MARSLLFSSSLVLLVGAIGYAGCGDDTKPPSGSGGSGAAGGASTSTSTSGGGEGGTGGTAGMGGMGGMGTSTSSTSGSGGSAGMGGMGGSGGAAGMGGSGGSGGAAGMGGSGGMGGAGGSGGMMELDPDHDGWTAADGDECENEFQCAKPASVNPGAFEYPGNGVDDDCDDSTPDNAAAPDCSEPALMLPTTSLDLVRAMDLCQFTTENPPLNLRKWGVISSTLVLADGSNAIVPKDLQVGVLSNFGTNVLPKRGATMAALSTGTARDENDAGYVHPQSGPDPISQKGNYVAGTKVSAPADYLIANGGKLPSPMNCPACVGADCTAAFDSVNLRVRLRVPTNAKSFSFRVKSYSAEYPEYVCGQYNDFFLTLLKSSWVPDPNANPPQLPLPVDRNIAKDSFGNAVTVNNAFYEVCYPYAGAPAGACPSGTLELLGTGMGGWNGDLKDGGGTEWLISEAPVVPGEKIDIEFIIADAGDSNVDSIVLLDYFRWGLEPTPVGVHK